MVIIYITNSYDYTYFALAHYSHLFREEGTKNKDLRNCCTDILLDRLVRILTGAIHILRVYYFIETHYFRTTCIKSFINKIVTMSKQFGHVRTVCCNSMTNRIVAMSGLFSDFRTKQRIAAKWTQMDTKKGMELRAMGAS